MLQLLDVTSDFEQERIQRLWNHGKKSESLAFSFEVLGGAPDYSPQNGESFVSGYREVIYPSLKQTNNELEILIKIT